MLCARVHPSRQAGFDVNEWIVLDSLVRPDVPMVMLNGNLDKVRAVSLSRPPAMGRVGGRALDRRALQIP